jgi:two-component system, cell cycle sensor histidine kinase and response regulator CckA
MGAGMELAGRRRDASTFPAEISLSAIDTDQGMLVTAAVRDVTERLEAQAKRQRLKTQAERDRLERQLQQSQRLESLGQLAGGVAHDFNNLLGVISSYAAFVAEELEKEAPSRDWQTARSDIEQVQRAAERAAGLTHQLLSFARREMVQPRVLNLNEVVASVKQLLVRGPILSRPVCRLEGQRHRHRDAPEVIDRAFEPFYTTKPKGEGSGLGLATVYGIVTQAGGNIRIYSEPELGTTLTVLLPVTGRAPAGAAQAKAKPEGGSGETVLVVEDESALREVTRRILARNGYKVIVAANGQEAIDLSDTCPGQIDLLLTDVVMPQMQGKEVADRVCAAQPGIPVLFMSGYTQGLLGAQGILAPGSI